MSNTATERPLKILVFAQLHNELLERELRKPRNQQDPTTVTGIELAHAQRPAMDDIKALGTRIEDLLRKETVHVQPTAAHPIYRRASRRHL